MRDIRCSSKTSTGGRCRRRATPQRRLCPGHDNEALAANGPRWSNRALAEDLATLDSRLESLETVQRVVEAVRRLRTVGAIDAARAKAVVYDCELAFYRLTGTSLAER